MSKHKRAVAEASDSKTSELFKTQWDQYGLRVYSVGRNGNMEFAVGTEEEVQAAAKLYIEEHLWAFNASFLAEYTELPEVVFTTLQSSMYEDANDPIEELVKRTDGGLDSLVEQAIEEDGRGHFLSGYDGHETEVTVGDVTFYVYRNQ